MEQTRYTSRDVLAQNMDYRRWLIGQVLAGAGIYRGVGDPVSDAQTIAVRAIRIADAVLVMLENAEPGVSS